MFKRRLIPIFLVLALTITLGLVAFSCNGTEGEEPSNIFWPTLTKVKIIPETNGHNGDEDSPVCLEKVGGEVEKFTLEITISNPDRWPILSFNYNDLTYTSEVFGAESNHQVVYLEKLSAPVESGEFTIKIDKIKYQKKSGTAYVATANNNEKKVRIQPTFTLTLDYSEAHLSEGENPVKEVENKFLSSFNLPTPEDMNETERAEDTIPYGKAGFIFDGWYTEKEGHGQKYTYLDSYNLYKDVTLYAHYTRAFKYTVLEDSVEIVGITNEGKATTFPIVIPREIEGKPVRKIASYAFSGVAGGKKFILPETLVEIGDYAFSNSKNLHIELGSVEKIGTMAFADCGEIILGAEDRYSSSRVAELPSTLRVIGRYAFKGSYWYTKAPNPHRDGMFRPENPTLLIPDTVDAIGEGAFQESGFTTIYFHRDITLNDTNFGEGVFAYSKSLQNVYFSYYFNTSPAEPHLNTTGTSGVKYIPKNTFYNCTALKNTPAYVGVKLNEGILRIGESAFSSGGNGMENLEYLLFPNSLLEIGKLAFANAGLTRVLFEEGSKLQTLGDNCFQSTHFEEITLHNLLNYGVAPFWGNTDLKAINILSPTVPTYNDADYYGDGVSTALRYYVKKDLLTKYRTSWNRDYKIYPNPAEKVCAYDYIVDDQNGNRLSFEPVDKDGNLDFTSSKVKINVVMGEEREIKIPSSILHGGVSYTVSSVGRYFVHENVTKVLLPSTIERIEERAFYGCSKLYECSWVDSATGTQLPKGKNENIELRYIGYKAFNSTAITNFYSNNKLTTIENEAFEYCPNLSHVVLERGAEMTIGADAFYGSGLKTLVIGSNAQVKYVKERAFQDNKSLTLVLINLSRVPESGEGKYVGKANSPFAYCDNLNKIYVFGSSVSDASTRISTLNESKIEGQNNGWSGLPYLNGNVEIGGGWEVGLTKYNIY